MFNTEKELEDLIDQWTPLLDKGLKTQKGLLEIALVPFDTIFEKDAKGNPIYKHLDKPQTKDLIGLFTRCNQTCIKKIIIQKD